MGGKVKEHKRISISRRQRGFFVKHRKGKARLLVSEGYPDEMMCSLSRHFLLSSFFTRRESQKSWVGFARSIAG